MRRLTPSPSRTRTSILTLAAAAAVLTTASCIPWPAIRLGGVYASVATDAWGDHLVLTIDRFEPLWPLSPPFQDDRGIWYVSYAWGEPGRCARAGDPSTCPDGSAYASGYGTDDDQFYLWGWTPPPGTPCSDFALAVQAFDRDGDGHAECLVGIARIGATVDPAAACDLVWIGPLEGASR